MVMSPRDAAIGMDTLSGLMLNFFEKVMITDMTAPSTREATDAVIREEAVSRRLWSSRTGSRPWMAPMAIAKMDARNATTIA